MIHLMLEEFGAISLDSHFVADPFEIPGAESARSMSSHTDRQFGEAHAVVPEFEGLIAATVGFRIPQHARLRPISSLATSRQASSGRGSPSKRISRSMFSSRFVNKPLAKEVQA
jgi:hypothetical protein